MFGGFGLLSTDAMNLLKLVDFRPTSFNGRTKRSSLNRDKGHSLASHGLNGKRAVARRLRQIEAGRYPKGSWINGSGATLRVQNGLVA